MKKILLLSLLAAFSFTVPQAWAQNVDLNNIKTVGKYSTMTPADFEANTELFSESPFGDPYLKFTIRLPKGWKSAMSSGGSAATPGDSALDFLKDMDLSSNKDQQKTEDTQKAQENYLNTKVLTPLARYVGEGRLDAVSTLTVEAVELDYGITLNNWLLHYIFSNGYNLQGLEQTAPNRVVAEYVFIENGISYVTRSAAVINANRIILVTYRVPDHYWNEERGMQDAVIESFNLDKVGESKIETTRTYSFLDFVRFDYPVNWRLLAPNIYSIEGMEARLINATGQEALLGEINISIVSTELDTTLADEVKYLQGSLKDRGYEIGGLIETQKDYSFSSHINFSRVEVYDIKNAKKGMAAQEYWLAIMAEDRFYYFVSMVSPSRRVDFYNWAKNIEAFKLVTESFRPAKAQ